MISYSPNYHQNREEGLILDRFTHVNVVKREPGKEEIIVKLNLDPENAIRYSVLSDLFELWDRAVLHNEHYGLDPSTGLWKAIPFDMDSSFGCGWYRGGIVDRIEELNDSKRPIYSKITMQITREIFDNEA